jgi:hypothetical protein
VAGFKFSDVQRLLGKNLKVGGAHADYPLSFRKLHRVNERMTIDRFVHEIIPQQLGIDLLEMDHSGRMESGWLDEVQQLLGSVHSTKAARDMLIDVHQAAHDVDHELLLRERADEWHEIDHRTESAQTDSPQAEQASIPSIESTKSTEPPAQEPPSPPEPGTRNPEPDKETVGIKNEKVDAEREKRGMLPREKPAAHTFAQVYDEALEIAKNDPQKGERLVKELVGRPRSLSDVEDALLTHEQALRQEEMDRATEAVNSAKTDADRVEAELRLAKARDDVYDAYEAGQKSGTENARGLNARKLLIYQDYTLARMESRARAVNGGKPLSEDKLAEIANLHAKLEDLSARLHDAEQARTAQASDDYFERLVHELTVGSKATSPESVS